MGMHVLEVCFGPALAELIRPKGDQALGPEAIRLQLYSFDMLRVLLLTYRRPLPEFFPDDLPPLPRPLLAPLPRPFWRPFP